MADGMETLKLLYLGIGPGIAIAVYIYYSDKWDPEPKALVVQSFIFGGLAVFPSIFFEEVYETLFGLRRIWDEGGQLSLGQNIFYAFIGVAMVEELCKYFFLKGFIYDNREFNEPFDGIIYGGMVGCGFATLENIMYVFELGYEVGILRLLTAVPSHAFEGMVLGYFVGRAKFCPWPEKYFAQGLTLVIILHGAYNTASSLNKSWSIYAMFSIVVLGIYLGLKAKRDLQESSEFVQLSKREYFILKDGKKYGPVCLRDIRDSLAKGTTELEDGLVDKESGVKGTVKEFLYSKIGSEYIDRVKVPIRRHHPLKVLIFYGGTFGFYLYFWYYRNYRDFKIYKNLNLNPELRTIVFYVITFIPFFTYGTIMAALGKNIFDATIVIPFNLFMAMIETAFLFFLFRLIQGNLNEELKKPFNVWIMLFLFFVTSVIRKLIPMNLPHYRLYEFMTILIQGGIFARVQKDLNFYWELETQKRSTTE